MKSAPHKTPRPKTCRNTECRAKFTPCRPLQIACGIKCALAIDTAKKDKDRKQADRIERAETRAAKEKLKRPSDHMKEAEKAVRDYRRLFELSIGSPCMSCGRSQEEIIAEQGWKTGGAFDAGHFLGKGARPELRLVPHNIWLQCKSCNAGSSKYARKGATVAQAFRDNLVARIGLEQVETLECDHEPRRYTIPELQAIKAEYRAKTRELKRAHGNA